MRDQRGFSLIDVLLAIALAGILGISVPSAISTAHKTNILGKERTMAESLARSQMDYVQSQPYYTANTTPVYAVITNLPAGYSITQTVVRLDPIGDGAANEDGLQKVTVAIKHNAETVYTLVTYKDKLDPVY